MSKLAIGTAQFGFDYGISSAKGMVGFEEVKRILSYASSNKINVLDTAPAYGISEEVIGKINPFNFEIVTKTRHFKNFDISIKDSRFIKKDLSNSLKKLKRKSVHALLIHNAEDLLKPNSKIIFDALQELKELGKISKLGVSIYNANHIESILDNFEIDIVQLPFNILDRRMIENGMLRNLKNKGIEVHARSIFLQGLLLMSQKTRPSKFNRWNNIWQIWHQWLNDNHISALEASIRYAISIPEISKVLVGVETKNQLEEIVVASNGTMPKMPEELYTNDTDLLNPSNWNYL